jgi:co-chaperonin GroES (HSP10)
MKPLGSNIIVLPDKIEEMTKSGFVIPNASDRLPNTGTVISCGKDVDEVTENDKVIFRISSCEGADIDGVTYYVCPEKEIVAVL